MQYEAELKFLKKLLNLQIDKYKASGIIQMFCNTKIDERSNLT